MHESRSFPTRDVEQDEGELNSEEDMQSSSSEGFTTDGEGGSDYDDFNGSGSPSANETPWERGLRLARERARKAKLMRQSDVDLEYKKLNLTVVAPDPSEDAVFADICDMGRSNPSDTFWLNYHKLSIVGSSQLTCKRALPCDLSPPSQNTITQWRRSLAKVRSRSKDSSASSPSSTPSAKRSPISVSSNFGSRSSSLSSLAGSIYLGVSDLLADELDREAQRRRRRRRHRSDDGSGRLGSASGSSLSSRSHSVSSRSSSPKPTTQKPVKRNRGSFSVSSRSRSGSASHSPHSRSRGRKGSFAGPRIDNQSSRASKRGPGMYGDQRQPQQSAMPPISGYNHQQTNFDRSSGGGFRDADGGSNYVERRNFGDSNRWREPSNRSPDRPPVMPSDRPLKRPWGAEQRPRAAARQRSPPPRQPPPPPTLPQHQRSRRSRSRPNEELEGSTTTYITSWSQPRSRQSAPSKPTSSDTGPLQSVPSPSRKRIAPGPSRRKSRSPFADSYFGNPPPPTSTGVPNVGEMSVPFEQTVPLLAGAVNPAAPPREMPPVSTRPGVKLTIAPRIRVGGSALDRPPRGNPPITTATGSNYRVAGGSPVSSTSSVGGDRRGRSQTRSPPPESRRGRRGSPPPPKRMRHAAPGYTAVSPGGFDSPQRPHQRQPASPPRLYMRNKRFDPDESAPARMRGRGPIHNRGGAGDGRHGRGDFQSDRLDRFSRGGGLPPDRYRDRRPPPPSSSNDRFDRRGGINDRNLAAYDRGRDYMGGTTHYSRSRGGRMDDDRVYGGRHDTGGRRRRDNHGVGGGVRSRSPFEGRRRRDADVGEQRFRDSSGSAFNTEARLDELRRRLAAVDDKITELGGGGGNR